jgi:membrane protease YdiL (CAAX protease family)
MVAAMAGATDATVIEHDFLFKSCFNRRTPGSLINRIIPTGTATSRKYATMTIIEIARSLGWPAPQVAELLRDGWRQMNLALLICLAGLILFGIWLLRTSWGRKAFVGSPVRRNDMPVYVPGILLFAWFGVFPTTILIGRELAADLPAWQTAAIINAVYCLDATALAAGTLILARHHFARRLKGFGLNPETIPKDFFTALLNLLTVWPLVMAALVLTIYIGRLIWGPQFDLGQHEELELIRQYSQLPLQISVFFVAVVMAPILEELLFRGMLQTMLRSLWSEASRRWIRPAPTLKSGAAPTADCQEGLTPLPGACDTVKTGAGCGAVGVWLSIAAGAALFAIAHANTGHWPALFILGVCLGYAYEKSGSLLRPIFIHSIFNAIMVVSALYA